MIRAASWAWLVDGPRASDERAYMAPVVVKLSSALPCPADGQANTAALHPQTMAARGDHSGLDNAPGNEMTR